ncbi:unnamed protein product [Cochlearia groenlandica]
MGGGGGTEAFPDLGEHCQNPNCKLLDFLPFTCDACKLVFCLDHRSYKSHDCPKSDHGSRTVSICETCSVAIETTGLDLKGIKSLLERHETSGDCDPKKKKKPTCPVKRCREILSFANNVTCKDCNVKFCLKHRFPSDHVCDHKKKKKNVGASSKTWNEKFMEALSLRKEKDCGRGSSVSSSSSSPSVTSF